VGSARFTVTFPHRTVTDFIWTKLDEGELSKRASGDFNEDATYGRILLRLAKYALYTEDLVPFASKLIQNALLVEPEMQIRLMETLERIGRPLQAIDSDRPFYWALAVLGLNRFVMQEDGNYRDIHGDGWSTTKPSAVCKSKHGTLTYLAISCGLHAYADSRLRDSTGPWNADVLQELMEAALMPFYAEEPAPKRTLSKLLELGANLEMPINLDNQSNTNSHLGGDDDQNENGGDQQDDDDEEGQDAEEGESEEDGGDDQDEARVQDADEDRRGTADSKSNDSSEDDDTGSLDCPSLWKTFLYWLFGNNHNNEHSVCWEVFSKTSDHVDAVKHLLQAGADPNVEF
jgi:hypothetical protein